MRVLLSFLALLAAAQAPTTPTPGSLQPSLAFSPSLAFGTSLPTSCVSQIYIQQLPSIGAATLYICDVATNTFIAPTLVNPMAGSAGFLAPAPSFLANPAATIPQ